jgi:chromosome segregation ATPase
MQAHRQDLTAARDLLSGQLDSARAEAQRLAALIDERAAALAERDQKLTTLRQAQEAAQKTWQLTGTALDARVAKLSSESDLRRAVHNAVQRLEQERLQHASEIEALIEDSAAQAASADSGLPASDHGEVTAFPVIAKEDGEREHEKPLIIERSAPLPEEIGRLIG